jgi:thymidylate kinase
MAGGMKIYGKHCLPGRLFIVEGIDGSGKSTQLMLLKKWLESEGYVVYSSEWNSSPGPGRHQARQEKKDAGADEFQSDSCDGLCRSHRTPHHSAA